jgi:glycosyltransferase involved in cell wall biosynthesis
MKLLYATSIAYPSEFANRVQIFSMSDAFARKLEASFYLGAMALRDRKNSFQAFELNKTGRSPFLSFRYIRFIRRQGITHVYCREDRLFFFMKIYALIFCPKVKFFFEAHAVREDRFFRYAVRRADGVVAITNGIKEELVAMGIKEEKILVEHDAVDLSLFAGAFSREAVRTKAGIPLNAIVVAYVGKYTTMGKHKGVDEFIESFALARKENPNLHLLLVGLSKGEVPVVESVCDRLSIPSSSRTLVAHIPSNEVPAYTRMSDMLVMNYPNTRHYARYMSPMKLFEYMASRVPIITTDLPSVREVLNDNETFYVPAEDSVALAGAIVEIASHKEEAAKRAARAYEKVSKEYTWDKRADAILDFISSSKR